MNSSSQNKDCTTCRLIGVIIAAIVVGLIAFYLSKTEPLWVVIVVFLGLLALGVWLANLFCCRGKSSESETETTQTSAAPAAKPKVTPTVATPEKTVAEPVKPEPAPKAETKPAPAPTPAAETSAAADSDNADADKPETLAGPRGDKADDLKKIKGVGPKLEKLLNSLGFYHFDQIANWSTDEIAWVDENLEGFRGRVSRDNWVDQAKQLAAGEDTDFSKKVDKGGVY